MEEVHREVGKVVPPGVALRRNERARRGNGERARPISTERAIQSGKRGIVGDAMAQANGRYFETTASTGHRDPNRQIRMVTMPPAIARQRALQAAGELFVPDEVIDKLLASEHPTVTLHNLSRGQVDRVALRLLERLRGADGREVINEVLGDERGEESG